MLTFIFVILLTVFFVAFVGLGTFDIEISQNMTLMSTLNDVGISMADVQVVLGIGILFCQVAIILFAMLDRIGFAVRAVIVPLLRLVPLIAFLTSIWKTYSPILFSLLPDRVAEVFGAAKVDNYMAQAVSDGTFMRGVIITLFTMLLFVLFTYALRPGDSPQVKQLKAENAKLRKQVRSL